MIKFIHHRLIKQIGAILLFTPSVSAWAIDDHTTMHLAGKSETIKSVHVEHTQNTSSFDKPKAESDHTEDAKSIMHHPSHSTSEAVIPHDTSVHKSQDSNNSHIHHQTTAMNDSAPMMHMDHRSMNGMSMTTHIGAMQGGTAPENARSSDYSEGRDFGPIHPPMMMGNDPFMSISFKRLEILPEKNNHQGAYEIEGWWGDDWNRTVLKAKGDIDQQKLSDAQTELLWRKPVDTFWNSELGVRQDSGFSKNRTWLMLGITGIAPYWVTLDATFHIRDQGQTAIFLTAEYDWRITQRLILQPSIEVSFYGKSDPINDIGRGLSKIDSSLRLRYEITRQFAPYIGLGSQKYLGQTGDIMKVSGQKITGSCGIHVLVLRCEFSKNELSMRNSALLSFDDFKTMRDFHIALSQHPTC